MSAFERLVTAMDGAMVVVTAAGDDGAADGCLVGFHSQCSIDPPQYAVWLSVANRTYELARQATHLGVHLVPAGYHGLAALFGGTTGDDVDKLATVPWHAGPGGAPLLDPLMSRFVGRVVEVSSTGGDHELFVLEVVSAEGPPVHPLRLADTTDIEPGHRATDRR